MTLTELEKIYGIIGDKEFSFEEFTAAVELQAVVVEREAPYVEGKISLLPRVHVSPESILMRAMENVGGIDKLMIMYRAKPNDVELDPLSVYSMSARITYREALTMLEETKFEVMSDWMDIRRDVDDERT